MKLEMTPKLAIAIVAVTISAGNVHAGNVRQVPALTAQQQIQNARATAQLKYLLVQLQAAQRQQAAQQARRVSYVPSSTMYASVLGGNTSSAGMGSTYIGGSTGGGLGSTYIGGVSAYSERLKRIERMSPQVRQQLLGVTAAMSQSYDNSIKVNTLGTYVYRARGR